MLADAGYGHYEISNWARLRDGRDYRCRHNLQYWLNDPYIGVGAGAQGYLAHQRLVNTPSLTDYVLRMKQAEGGSWSALKTPATISAEEVDFDTRMMDEMMLGLRLIQQGVSEKRFAERYGRSLREVFDAELSRLTGLGLLEWVEDGGEQRIRLTHHGVMVANQVFMAFV
jgi:oxygen-independent coproporphyrinogen-3 oxidase